MASFRQQTKTGIATSGGDLAIKLADLLRQALHRVYIDFSTLPKRKIDKLLSLAV